MQKLRWKTLLGLTLVYAGVIFNQPWLFGILFLFWTFESIKNKKAYILEEIQREFNPVLYWIIVITWFVLGLFYFDFFNNFFG